jgi:hypothetical protein
MTTNTVDWSTLATDPATAPSVADLEALAHGFDPDVPTVLVPVRVETRFTTVEVPDLTDHLDELIDRVRAVAVSVQRLADIEYPTELTGPVAKQKQYKDSVERPLYALIETRLESLGGAAETLRHALGQPITSATPRQLKALEGSVAQVRAAAKRARW